MNFLLAARGRCVVHRNRSRREHLYVREQVFGRLVCLDSGLMRHLCELASIKIALMPAGVIRATRFQTLVTATNGAQQLAPCRFNARHSTITLTTITVGA